ncbi:MAG: hypothetical protein ACREDF_04150 [Thermoplasmata archaeon]
MSETIEDRQRPSYVAIIKYREGDNPEKVVKLMGPCPLWKAEQVDGGANINLNHDGYYTLILTKDEMEKWKERGAIEESA